MKEQPSIKKYEEITDTEFNPNSPLQKQIIFFGKDYENLLSIKKTKKTKKPATDKDVLED